jgi:hypothetical protein
LGKEQRSRIHQGDAGGHGRARADSRGLLA